jgi:cytochrome c-type biogenesis protein CcmH/NrfG
MGNIYKHRNMIPEAERAYLEALELWPANPEVLSAYSEILWNREDFDGVKKILEPAYDSDPNNTGLVLLYGLSEQRRESQTEIASLHATLKTNAADAEAFTKLLKIYAGWGETNKAGELLQSNIHLFTNNPATLKAIASYAESTQMKAEFVEAAGYLSEASPKDPISHYILARALLAAGSTNEAFTAASNSVSLGGRPIRSLLASDPAFSTVIKSPPFDALVKPTVPTP